MFWQTSVCFYSLWYGSSSSGRSVRAAREKVRQVDTNTLIVETTALRRISYKTEIFIGDTCPGFWITLWFFAIFLVSAILTVENEQSEK
jgi:hypothetical protein